MCEAFGGLTRFRLAALGTALAISATTASAQKAVTGTSVLTNATVVAWEGTVEVAKWQVVGWQRARTNQVLLPGDRLRTGERSRAVLRMSNLSALRLGEFSQIEVPRPEEADSGFNFRRGIFYFFHRDKPATLPVRTPAMVAVTRGTEFNLAVEENGRTTLSVLDGAVEMSNPSGQLTLTSGEAGMAETGQAPRRTAVVNAVKVVQWALYYPAVLDAEELELAPGDQQVLADSLTSYRAGDLLRALAQYPAGRQPAMNREKVYLAALVLAVGRVEEAEGLLVQSPKSNVQSRDEQTARVARLAEALGQVIAAVTNQSSGTTVGVTPRDNQVEAGQAPRLASEWLGASYGRQSRGDLEGARAAASEAVKISPRFGFGWERLAELEFGFGRIREAEQALKRSLELAPHNAQAVALKGFLLSAQNKTAEATQKFEQAMALDGALGNAWLGRGLCRIRQGHAEAGREDLQIASTLEPQRALLRSYLGKAFSNEGDSRRAAKEIELAKQLDPRDPTGWLYSALLRQQESQINGAVRDLERSQQLNDNRQIYRSGLLLDQDQAVRGANLAGVYQDAGMIDVSVREAVRAVNTDYANYSAHLFLANSYDALRDPRQINLRYDTPWLSEYLLANLLAPVGAGTLSPYVTQQEYSKLFERDRLGLVSSTEYFSNGDWLQNAAQYGLYQNSSYAVEEAYRSENGHRPNNDLDQLTLSLKVKQQVTPADSVYAQAIYYRAEAGDLNQYYNESKEANPGLRVKERQEPIVLAGYQHEWAPGSHSLLLAGRLSDTLEVFNPRQQTLLFDLSFPPSADVIPVSLTQSYRSELEMYTVEAQQIWQQPNHGLIIGGRFQTGDIQTQSRQTDPVFPVPIPLAFQAETNFTSNLQRISAYGYYQWRVVEPLLLVAGVSYDRLLFPENFRYAPISGGEETKEQISPKAGFIWTPTEDTTVRAAYSRSLGGIGLDQSFQLEPSQVAGFNQAFRSIIPESVAGANTAAPFRSWGVSLEQKLPSLTYLGLSGEWLESKVDRSFGVFEFLPGVVAANTRERLDYRERSLTLTVNQLLSTEWSLGAKYRVSLAELDDRFLDIPASAQGEAGFVAHQNLEALLHQVQLFALFNHRSGFFATAESLWSAQSNQGYSPARPGDDFWQFNLFAGYRFPRRRAEVRAGLLNLTDRDYHLNPLNLHAELPHNRTFTLSLRFYF